MLPQAFVHRIHTQFTDADAMLAALSLAPATSVRLHPVKGKNIPTHFETIVPWCSGAGYIKERPVFTLDPAFHAGAYYVQESSSMFLWKILDQVFPGRQVRILDLCAAPGGKSTLIASWLAGEGLLVSNEVIKTRALVLLENIIKWGYANTWVTSTDAYVLGGLHQFFDAVVLDAPCSGEGLFRKDPAAAEEWSEANCDLCAARQKKIIADILPALSEGGSLIYSTCTYNPAENDENVAWMLQEFPLEIMPVDITPHPEIQLTEGGGYAFYPHHTQGEGFYVCILKKTGDTAANEHVQHRRIKWEKPPKEVEPARHIRNADMFTWVMQQQKIAGIAAELTEDFETIAGVTKILGGYVSIGGLKGKDLVPDHALAMSLHYQLSFPCIELDLQQALYYLSRKDFKIETTSAGWHTILYQSLPLGFAKLMPNRMNNYYPVEWRIRMQVE